MTTMMILMNISIFYLILFLALVIQIDQAKVVLTGMSCGHRLSSRFVMKIDSIREVYNILFTILLIRNLLSYLHLLCLYD